MRFNARHAIAGAAACWAALLLAILGPWASSPLMPANDFPGGASYFWCVDTLLRSHWTLPSWNPFWFNGCSNLFVAGQWGSLPFVLPLIRLLGVLKGLKWAVALFMAAGSLTMGLFLSQTGFSAAACVFGSCAYAFFPLQLVSGVVSGHVVVSMIFSIIPLCFLFLEKHGSLAWGAREPLPASAGLSDVPALFARGLRAGAAPTGAYLALVTALTVSFDLEKGIIIGLMMVLYGFVRSLNSSMNECPAGIRGVLLRGARDLGVMAVPGLLSMCLVGFTVLPLAARTGEFAIFPREIIESSRLLFSMPPLPGLLDRFSAIGSSANPQISAMFANFSGFHYIGLLLLPLMALAVSLREGPIAATAAPSAGPGARPPGPLPFAVLFLASMALSQGPFSIATRNRGLPGAAMTLARDLAGREKFFFAALLVSVACCLAAVIYTVASACLEDRGPRVVDGDGDDVPRVGAAREGFTALSPLARAGLVGMASMLFLFVPWFPILERLLPVFNHLRSPMWFFNMAAGFSLSVGGAAVFEAPATRNLGRRVRIAMAMILVGALLLDASAYAPSTGSALKPFQFECLERLHSSMKGGEGSSVRMRLRDFRVLHGGSYSPAEDAGMMFSNAGSPWYWLNWMAPRHLHPIMFGLVFPTLETLVGAPSRPGGPVQGTGRAGDMGKAAAPNGEQTNRASLVQGLLRLMQVRYISSDISWDPGAEAARALGASPSIRMVHEALPPEDMGFAGYRLYELPDDIPYARIYEAAAIYFGDQGLAPAASWVCHLKGSALICAPERVNPESVAPDVLSRFQMVVTSGAKVPPGLPRGKVFELPADSAALDRAPGFPQSFRRMRVTRPRAGRIEVDLGPGGPGILVLSESYHPDWRVFLDGRESKPMRAQSVFIGAEIGRETGRVVFEHQWPWLVWPGLFLTFSGLAIAAFLVFSTPMRAAPADSQGVPLPTQFSNLEQYNDHHASQ